MHVRPLMSDMQKGADFFAATDSLGLGSEGGDVGYNFFCYFEVLGDIRLEEFETVVD